MTRRLSTIIFLLFFYLSAFSQNDTLSSYSAIDTLQNDFGLFKNEEVFQLSLRFDITRYTREKTTDTYLPAILTYHISETDSINKEIKLKSRGAFRNKFCQFPPLSLNFKKTEFSKDDLNKIEKVKLVTHCERGNEDYLFREYLVYKLYNVLTDYSFRVRLVKMNYINTAKKSKPISTYAFFVEPIELLDERKNTTNIGLMNLGQNNILPENMDLLALFFYMIGNTDWSIGGQHNVKILTRKNSEHPELGILVPYDFDYSGLVNAYYATPYEKLGLKSVRERYYQGLCRDANVFQKSLDEYVAKKDELYKTVLEFPYLNDKSKKDIIKFLDSFYEGIANGETLTKMLGTCLKL
jgi:hypothetical protein